MEHALRTPDLTEAAIARLSLEHLEQVVRIDSASDERSASIPSTPGQADLAQHVATFMESLGARVTRDDFANVIAELPGRGVGANQSPVALLVHLDTARGTAPLPALHVLEGWDGTRVPYPKNDALCVDLQTYPAVAEFLGHDLVYGDGDAPFGLDDKLGLAHLMTLARLLAACPEADHPPLLLIGRPDEEVGRMAAVEGLAELLAARGVDMGYTVDGILPFEVNVENFNASHGAVRFAPRADARAPAVAEQITYYTGGVNTHGCTAKAEGYRAATRLAAEVLQRLIAQGDAPQRVYPLAFASDDLRDCDARVVWGLAADEAGDTSAARAALEGAMQAVLGPHLRRGASWRVLQTGGAPTGPANGAVWDCLTFVHTFLHSDAGVPLAAEESEGHQGYSAPFRAFPDAAGMRLDVRIRDFSPDGLAGREAWLHHLAGDSAEVAVSHQYANMAPRLAGRPELIAWPVAAARPFDVPVRREPIRGGTGVDPFIDRGIAIANIGTGYFAPESEKEFTSLQLMARHALWLFALVQVIAAERA